MVSRLTLFCDRCDEDDRSVEGRAEQIGVNQRWYEVHLCEQCRKDLAEMPFAVVVQFFLDHGEATKASIVASSDEMPCLWCDRTYSSPGGMDNHLRSHHHFASAEVAWGSRCPACGSQDFTRMATHATRSHRRHVSQLMAEAVLQGDPYGVVKERLRAAKR